MQDRTARTAQSLCAMIAAGGLMFTAVGAQAYPTATVPPAPDPTSASVAYAVNNPCSDPWISLTVSIARTNRYGPGRAFTSNGKDGECAAANYNGGHWQHFSELQGYVNAYFRSNPSTAASNLGRNNPCSDPWISYAVSFLETAGGTGKAGRAVGSGTGDQCAAKLYNNGSWGNYGQLLDAVQATQTQMWNQNVRFQPKSQTDSTPALVKIDATRAIGVAPAEATLVLGKPAPAGSGLVGPSGGTITATAGGDIVAQGAGNIVAQGAGNIVSTSGSNIANMTTQAGVPKAKLSLPSGMTLFVH